MRWVQQKLDEPGEIEVTELLPDLPAQQVLRLGDRITHVGEADLRNNDDLLRYAQSRQPGDTISLTVRRVIRDENGNAQRDELGLLAYDTIHVELALGSAEKLREADGTMQRQSPVLTDRRRAAREFARSFSADPRSLHLDPDSVVPRSLESTPTNVAAGTQSVDQHRYVQAIARERHQLEQGLLDPEGVQRVWRNRVLALRQRLAEEQLSPRDRQYVQDVLERCLQLISQP
jgi:hypothetical protein